MSVRPRSSRASAGRLMATWLNRGWRFFFPSVIGVLSGSGDDEHLGCQLGARQLVHGVEEAGQRYVIRFDEQVDRERARPQEGQRGGEAAGVVVVGAGDEQLVEQDAV